MTLLAAPASSPAAVDFGSNLLNPADNATCAFPSCTMWNADLHPASIQGSLTAPISGVVVSFTIKKSTATANWPPLHLRVVEPVSGSFWRGLGASSPGVVPTNVAGLETFPVRLPISQGDYLGVEAAGPAVFFTSSSGVFGAGMRRANPALPADGSPADTTAENRELLLQARIEPDTDNDGFGDETQDQCPTDPGKQNECVPPDTEITDGPKHKTRKKTATFGFGSNEPGSSFECALDGKTNLKPCTSPLTVKVKRGRHTFQVGATDAAGNPDASPATDDWKVKKKKRD